MSATEQSIENGGGQQIQSDWNQANNAQPDFIKNKPLIPAAQIQSDWNQTNNLALDFIKNKPLVVNVGIQSELTWSANVVATRNVVGGFVNIHSINYPINANVVDGRSRRIKIIANYSKAIGNSTIGFQITVGGVTLTFPTIAMGGAVINNDTFVFDIFMNFRSGTGIFVKATERRFHPNNDINELVKTNVVGVWDKSIANTVNLQWQTVSGTPLHTLTIQQITSELL